MAMMEMSSVFSVMPFLSVLIRLKAIQEPPFLRAVYQYFAFGGMHAFILALGMTSIAIVVFSGR
jgi:hypothetical protein